MRSSIPALALFVSALFAAWPSHAGWGTDAAGPHVAVCTASGTQSAMQAVSDGAGGVIVAWVDQRPGASTDIYAQRISAAGVPLWTADGVVVINLLGVQDQPAMVSDGAGGAILVWSDYRNLSHRDLWAQRLNAAGARQWGTNGVQVTGAANDQDVPRLAPDGAGGALVCWRDKRSTTSADVYAQRLSSSGTLLWTNSGFTTHGVPVSVAPGSQVGRIAADGVGGAMVAWGDSAGGNYDVKIQRLAAANGLEQWTAGGVSVIADSYYQYFSDVIPDGFGGAIVTWGDTSPHYMYAHRFDASGTKLWYSNGIAISGFIDDQSNRHHAIPDGTGGLFAGDTFGAGLATAVRFTGYGMGAWGSGTVLGPGSGFAPEVRLAADGQGGCVVVAADEVGGLSAFRLNGAGVSQWSSAGEPVQRMTYVDGLEVVATTDGHFIVVWVSSAGADVFAERIDIEGALGAPAPVITAVDDVANDQGGQVKVSWDRSDRDTDPLRAIVDYRLWRSVPASSPAFGTLAARRGTTADADEAAATGRLLVGPLAAAGYAWELAGSQAAATLASYSLSTATESDSIAASNPFTVFMVEARAGTSLGAAHWFSAPDSGYSVDDLPPAQPAPFAAVYATGSAALHWEANTEADLAHYRVYRGTAADFPLDGAHLVAETTDTTLTHVASQAFFYKLVAVDVHGNVSPFAFARPDGNVGAPGAGSPAALALAPPSPHPVRSGIGATLRFALPAAGRATLRLFDAQGRERATVVDGVLESGEHVAVLRRDRASLPSGIYFLRLDTAAGQRVRKVAVAD